jgi:hypothetical protein
MTTDRSSKTSFDVKDFSPRVRLTTSRTLGALLTASLLTATGCQHHEDRKAPTDNSAVIPGRALVKFCHDLRLDGKPITLSVEFGQPALASISAVSGTCSPPIPMPCTGVPVGTYPGRLMDGPTVLHAVTVQFNDGEEYLLRARISSSTGRPIVVKDRDFNPGNCAQFDGYPKTDGGAGDGGTDASVDAADAAAPDVDAALDAAVD